MTTGQLPIYEPLGERILHGTTDGGPEYADASGAVRDFLDAFAASAPDSTTTTALATALREWSKTLSGCVVDESGQIYGRRPDLPARGQVAVPWFALEHEDEQSARACVRFGRAHMGGNAAVHGGFISVVLDEILGHLANHGRTHSRTAYLRVDYRALTPVERDLRVEAAVTAQDGRKRYLHAALLDGDILCAEATALFVGLRPGQS